jgi:trans-aconitate methyltransferase
MYIRFNSATWCRVPYEISSQVDDVQCCPKNPGAAVRILQERFPDAEILLVDGDCPVDRELEKEERERSDDLEYHTRACNAMKAIGGNVEVMKRLVHAWNVSCPKSSEHIVFAQDPGIR